MDDLISRQDAIDAPERFLKDCNPEHFVGHQKFIEYMDNAEIGSFGNWQFANGFNMGLTAAEVSIKKLPSAQPHDIARDIATIIENEKDMRVMLKNAQPEVIRCKDCLMHGVCRFEQGLGLDGYCSQAERRTDE